MHLYMKIKKGFELHDVCGERVIVACGEQHIDFTKVICMNETAAYLWDNVVGKWDNDGQEITAPKDFDAPMLADLLLAEYEVDGETALKDATSIVQLWTEQGLAE